MDIGRWYLAYVLDVGLTICHSINKKGRMIRNFTLPSGFDEFFGIV